MKRILNLTILAVIIMSLILSPALASFSPGMAVLDEAYAAGGTFRLELTGDVTNWGALSPGSLPAVRELLKDLTLEIDFSKERENLRLLRGGISLLDLSSFFEEGKSSLGKDKAALLSCLTGMQNLSVLADLPTDALLRMAPFSQRQTRRTVLKDAGTSKEFLEYHLPVEVWLSLWPDIQGSLSKQFPDVSAEITKALNSISFDQAVTVRRYLDETGRVMGLYIKGKTIFPQNDVRNFSLTLAYKNREAISLSLKAPAVRGKNSLTLSLSLVKNEERFAADMLYESRVAKERYLLKGKAALKNTAIGREETISGTLWLEEKKGTDQAARLTLRPTVVLDSMGTRGTVDVIVQRNEKNFFDARINLALRDANDVVWPASDAAASEVLLLPLVRDLLLTLPLPERKLLLHDLGRTLRTRGDSMPPIYSLPPDYLVIDEP